MTRKLAVYAARSHYTEDQRLALNDILKAHWTDASLADRRATYGRSRVDGFEPVDDPARADLHLLPMKWPHYVKRGLVDRALAAVALARRVKRPIVVFSESDWTANFPVAGQDIHLFELSGYRSRCRQRVHGMPAFISDPVAAFCGGALDLGHYRARATLGFCGQAGAGLARHAARWVQARARIAEWKLGLRTWEPTPMEHAWFRHRVLEAFARSPAVDTRYVLRSQYRAGISKVEGRTRARRDGSSSGTWWIRTTRCACVAAETSRSGSTRRSRWDGPRSSSIRIACCRTATRWTGGGSRCGSTPRISHAPRRSSPGITPRRRRTSSATPVTPPGGPGSNG